MRGGIDEKLVVGDDGERGEVREALRGEGFGVVPIDAKLARCRIYESDTGADFDRSIVLRDLVVADLLEIKM